MLCLPGCVNATVVVGPNEVAESTITVPCTPSVPGEISFACCVVLRKLIPAEFPANLVLDGKKKADIPGPEVKIIVPVVVFRELKRQVCTHQFQTVCIPPNAEIVACRPVNVTTAVTILGFDPVCGENKQVQVTVTFDVVVLFSAQVDGKTQIVSRQFCDLTCVLVFCVPEPETGELVAKAKVEPVSPFCRL
ncbi:MAG: hypothetical protein PHC60_04255 [Heliobacteriaceae bacterium]|nr:hypothetical protein [Heliobacteriaceae bacterium]